MYNASLFISLDRNVGTVLHTKLFEGLTYAKQTAGIPSIGSDGTIYVACQRKLYALDPSDLSEKWNKELGVSSISQAPAIDKDGILYIPYYKSNNEQSVAAINSANGSIKWEIPFSLGDYDHIQEVYVDSHGRLCFTIITATGTEPDKYSIYGYENNGNSANFLWKYDLNSSGGTCAFGPNHTIYVTPSTGYGHTITAISELPEGATSFPEYTNNIPPDEPTYSSPSDGLQNADTSLTFSWNCSSPDGHSLKYTFYLGFSDMLDVYQSDITNNSITINGLQPDSVYLWSVAATDGQSTTQGPISSFTTKKSSIKYSVVWVDNFDNTDSWTDKLYKGNGTFTSGSYDGESVGIFNMSGSPGVLYTFKQLNDSIPSGSILQAKWYYESSGSYTNSENSDGGHILFTNSIPDVDSNISKETIETLFAARDYPMYQWDTEEFTITQNIPAGSYISIGGAVWPSSIINNWDFITISSPITDIKTEEKLPKEYKLFNNYPNPFNPITTIRYSVSKDAKVQIKVYGLLGNEIETLVNEYKHSGTYQILFDGSNLSSGVYFYRIISGNFLDTKKMVLLK